VQYSGGFFGLLGFDSSEIVSQHDADSPQSNISSNVRQHKMIGGTRFRKLIRVACMVVKASDQQSSSSLSSSSCRFTVRLLHIAATDAVQKSRKC